MHPHPTCWIRRNGDRETQEFVGPIMYIKWKTNTISNRSIVWTAIAYQSVYENIHGDKPMLERFSCLKGRILNNIFDNYHDSCFNFYLMWSKRGLDYFVAKIVILVASIPSITARAVTKGVDFDPNCMHESWMEIGI